MQTTYDTAPSPANPWQLGPTASKMARWIFGFGFFSVHLGIFLIGGLALLMFNLYRSPEDLWVGGPLLRWGVVVLIHLLGAIVTWAVTTAMDAAEATKRENAVYDVQRSPVPAPAPVVVAPEPPTVPLIQRPRFQPALSTPVETIDIGDTRRFGFRGWKSEPETPVHRPSPPGWRVVRSGDAEPATFVPASTPPLTPPVWAPPAPSQPGSTPGLAASHASPARSASPVAEDDSLDAADNRWTWVEAAAEAWLANRHDTNHEPTSRSQAEADATGKDEQDRGSRHK